MSLWIACSFTPHGWLSVCNFFVGNGVERRSLNAVLGSCTKKLLYCCSSKGQGMMFWNVTVFFSFVLLVFKFTISDALKINMMLQFQYRHSRYMSHMSQKMHSRIKIFQHASYIVVLHQLLSSDWYTFVDINELRERKLEESDQKHSA